MTATTWQRAQRVPLELSIHLLITHPSPESDQLGFSDPVPRPRRALLPETPRPGPPRPETLLPDADKEKTTAAEAGIGRRAMDPLPSRYAEPAVRLESGRARGTDTIRDKPAAATQCALTEF